jgi:hypothetical protein
VKEKKKGRRICIYECGFEARAGEEENSCYTSQQNKIKCNNKITEESEGKHNKRHVALVSFDFDVFGTARSR